MFFDWYREQQILDIFRIHRPAGKMDCQPRAWDALAYRISGESVFEWKGKRNTAGPGSLLFIPAGLPFSRVSTEEELIILHLHCRQAEEKNIEIQQLIHPADGEEPFSLLCACWREKLPGYSWQCAGMLHGILGRLMEEKQTPLLSRKQRLIQPGVDYLHTAFDQPHASVEHAASLCPMSAEYFRRLYREAFGVSPRQAIMDKRLEKACRLLQSGLFSIQETAEMAGFDDCKYFSALFHRKMGMPPRDYKRLFSR